MRLSTSPTHHLHAGQIQKEALLVSRVVHQLPHFYKQSAADSVRIRSRFAPVRNRRTPLSANSRTSSFRRLSVLASCERTHLTPIIHSSWTHFSSIVCERRNCAGRNCIS